MKVGPLRGLFGAEKLKIGPDYPVDNIKPRLYKAMDKAPGKMPISGMLTTTGETSGRNGPAAPAAATPASAPVRKAPAPASAPVAGASEPTRIACIILPPPILRLLADN